MGLRSTNRTDGIDLSTDPILLARSAVRASRPEFDVHLTECATAWRRKSGRTFNLERAG